jgi:putative transposase
MHGTRRRHRLDLDLYRDPERVFAVTIGTAPRAPVFADPHRANACRDLLVALARDLECPMFAYCLMPDHVHLLVSGSPEVSLVGFVQRWKSLCWRAVGRGEPSLWQRSFWDNALRREDSLRRQAFYILHNPVRAGLVTCWREYPWAGSEVFRF